LSPAASNPLPGLKNLCFFPAPLANASFEDNIDGKPWSMRRPGYSFTVSTEQPFHGAHSMCIENEAEIISEPLFEQHAEVGEMIDKQLGAGLRCLVPLALYSRNGQTIPSPEMPLESLVTSLAAIRARDLTGEDLSVRLAAVVKAWNVFQHFYPYLDLVDADWDQVLRDSLGLAQK
jgi:hypothetical protein